MLLLSFDRLSHYDGCAKSQIRYLPTERIQAQCEKKFDSINCRLHPPVFEFNPRNSPQIRSSTGICFTFKNIASATVVFVARDSVREHCYPKFGLYLCSSLVFEVHAQVGAGAVALISRIPCFIRSVLITFNINSVAFYSHVKFLGN